MDDRFYLAPSRLPKAGRGLFAAKPVRTGERLRVTGPAVATNSAEDHCTLYADDYKFYAREDKLSKIIPTGYAGMVNHAVNREGQNVRLAYDRGYAEYLFTRDVAPGEEVLGYYGDQRNVKIFFDVNGLGETAEWDRFLKHDLYHTGLIGP